MTAQRPQHRSRRVRRLFSAPLVLEHETALFLLVNLLDFLMTALVVQRHGFREANALPRAVLQLYGMRGLLIYKFLLVTVISLLCQVIAIHRPGTAKLLLNTATALLSLIVIRTLVILLQAVLL